jgi:hypothetical protein
LTCFGLNLNPGYFGGFNLLSLYHVENRVCLSHGAGDRCDMAGSDKDRDRSMRPVAENWGWSHRLGTQRPNDREVGGRCGQSASCTWRRRACVSWLSLKIKVNGLSVV